MVETQQAASLPDFHVGYDRHSWTQQVILVLVRIEEDAYGNSLHNLHVVTGCIFGREQTETGAAGSANGLHCALVLASTDGVNFDFHRLSRFHVLQLRLFEVCGDPDIIDIHQRHQRLPWLHVLAHFGSAVTNNSVQRRTDLRVLKIQLSLLQLSLVLGRCRLSRGSASLGYAHLPWASTGVT